MAVYSSELLPDLLPDLLLDLLEELLSEFELEPDSEESIEKLAMSSSVLSSPSGPTDQMSGKSSEPWVEGYSYLYSLPQGSTNLSREPSM